MGNANDNETSAPCAPSDLAASKEAAEDVSEDASDRIAKAFESMSCANRRVMASVIRMCAERVPVSRVNELVAEETGDHAVFDGPALCRLLERAGALVRQVDEAETAAASGKGGADATREEATAAGTGDPDQEGSAGSPNLPGTRVTPAPPRRSYWLSTKAALDYLDSFDEFGALDELREREGQWWPVYEELFDFLGDQDGCNVDEVTAHLRCFEPFQKVQDRLAPAHVLDQAQQAGAIEWRDGWRLTETGRKAILRSAPKSDAD